MIKIDVSKIVPKRLGTYLLAIIPGLLFELSVAFGDPQLGHRMLDRAKQIYPFQPYALLILFLASCLVVGQTFFLLSWFAEQFIVSLYWFQRFLLIRATLGSDWLYRTFGRLQGVPPKRTRFIRILSQMVRWGRQKRFPFEIRPILECQRLAVTQVLHRKYGIRPNNGPWEWEDREWQVWFAMLGKQPTVFREAFLTMRTFLGCGLSELTALYISPALRNRYFVAITMVLVTAGSIQAFDFARRRYEPMRNSFTRLASVLTELAEVNLSEKQKEDRTDKGTSLTINTDAKEED